MIAAAGYDRDTAGEINNGHARGFGSGRVLWAARHPRGALRVEGSPDRSGLTYPKRETSTAFSVMNSSKAGVPSRVFSMPRRIAAWISPGSVTRSP